MSKKLLSVLLSTAMVAALLVGCGNSAAETEAPAAETEEAAPAEEAPAEEAEAPAEEAPSTGTKVGVSMPTKDLQRWNQDGANMQAELEAAGYEVDLQYAGNDETQQLAQIENMISGGANVLVIAAIEASSLGEALDMAKAANIPVIAYDRLLMNSDAVSYYATFDNKGVGTAIGKYIEEKKDLANTTETFTIEFFMGSPDDNNAHMLYDGLMEVLQPYLDKGTLVCKSGRTSFDDTCILRWSQETAQQNCENYLTGFYADEDLDICATAFDGFAYGCKAALEGAGYTADNWPLITGQDAELMATKNIISGSQTMSIYKDTRLLAEKCVKMVQAVLEGEEPEINDTEQYNNNVIVVPSYLCTPVAVDKDNYKEIIVDGGYYTEEQLAE